MNFCSDNTTGAAPEIMAALAEANAGQTMPYGEDALTERLTARFGEVFETDVAVFPVTTGTAAKEDPFSLPKDHRHSNGGIAIEDIAASLAYQSSMYRVEPVAALWAELEFGHWPPPHDLDPYFEL